MIEKLPKVDSKEYGVRNQHNSNNCAECHVFIPYNDTGYFWLNPKTDRFDLLCGHCYAQSTVEG